MQYKSYIDDVNNMLEEAKKQACDEIGFLVEAEAKLRTPVLSGTLKRAETHEVIEDGVRVGSNVPYDIYVEFGTSKAKAQPHWIPAVEENTDKIEKIVEKIYKSMMGGK